MHGTDSLVQIIKELLIKSKIDADVFASEEKPSRIAISSKEDLSVLVGRDGSHLEAIEHLVRIIHLRKFPNEKIHDFYIDANDFRKMKTDNLIAFALNAAEHVIKTGIPESLEPMSSFERKIIHSALGGKTGITSESIGIDPNRRVVIKPV